MSRSRRDLPPTAYERPLVLSLLALFLCLGGCDCDGEPRRVVTPVAYPEETEESLASLQRETQVAARRGVDYLLAKRGSLPGEWGLFTYAMLARMAPDEELAARCRSALNESAQRPQAELPADLGTGDLLEVKRLRPLLNELWRRRIAGESWEPEVAQLQSLLGEREEELWTPMAIGDQLVTLHLLHRLGIQTRLSVDDIMAELRWMWGVGDQDALLLDVAFMYAVTHIFYVGSGYFQERLDPERYPNEIALFDRALESYARSFPENANFVDISGEILASRRLLGLPETGASRALIRELLRRQKPDGSWLVPRGFQDVHATASVVHGVIDWPAEFRRLPPPGDAG